MSPQVLALLGQHQEFALLEAMECLPGLAISPIGPTQVLSCLQGPGESTAPTQNFGPFACGGSLSTYPAIQGHPFREGDPNCDRFCIRLYENRVIAAVADGLQWGTLSRKAAKRGTRWFTSTLEQHLKEMPDLKSVGPILLASLAEAHSRILQAKKEGQHTQSTGLLGGVLLEIDSEAAASAKGASKDKDFAFAYVSVGQCRCYLYSAKTQTLHDWTAKKAGISSGSIGGLGKPNLQDAFVQHVPCNEGDVIIMCSHGVSDNLDPILRGTLPEDLSFSPMDPLESSLYGPQRLAAALEHGQSLLSENPAVASIVESLLGHSLQVTKRSREHIERYPDLPLNPDLWSDGPCYL